MDTLLEVVATTPVIRTQPMPDPDEEWGAIVLEEGDTRTSTVTIHQAVPGGRVAKEAAGGAPFFISDTSVAALGAQLDGSAASASDY